MPHHSDLRLIVFQRLHRGGADPLQPDAFEHMFGTIVLIRELPVSPPNTRPGRSGDLPTAREGAGPPDTKQRLLDAAERLFAERGFEGTSMRAVTQAAETSVSAANYHFGSKEALVQAALVRRLAPLNRRRLEALDALEAAHDGDPPVEALLEAFLRPGFEAQRESPAGRLPFQSIAAQLYADPHAMVSSLKAKLFGPVIARYIEALARALPDRTRDELVLDFQFFIGVTVHVISGHTRAEDSGGELPAIPDERVLQRMVSFTAAGLRSKTLTQSAVRMHGRAQ
jgi:AcrR family transcriptional regulator